MKKIINEHLTVFVIIALFLLLGVAISFFKEPFPEGYITKIGKCDNKGWCGVVINTKDNKQYYCQKDYPVIGTYIKCFYY